MFGRSSACRRPRPQSSFKREIELRFKKELKRTWSRQNANGTRHPFRAHTITYYLRSQPSGCNGHESLLQVGFPRTTKEQRLALSVAQVFISFTLSFHSTHVGRELHVHCVGTKENGRVVTTVRQCKRCHVTSCLHDETFFRKHCTHYQRPLACHFPAPIRIEECGNTTNSAA